MRKEKIRKLVEGLSSFDDEVVKSIDTLNTEIAEFTKKIKAGVTAETLDQVRSSFKKLERSVEPLNSAVTTLGENLSQREEQLLIELRDSIDGISRDIERSNKLNYKEASDFFNSRLDKIQNATKSEVVKIGERISKLNNILDDIENRLVGDIRGIDGAFKRDVSKLRKTIESLNIPDPKEWQRKFDDLQKRTDRVRADLLGAVSRVRGGGNANRNILVGNNPSVLGRYTDLNLKAGTNVTLSYTNNDNLKTTDLTIAAAAGTGVVRAVETLAVSSVLADTASTDFVFIASQGVQLTLPTAVGNTNLYTIKNAAASSVLVTPNGAETIDGEANIILATRYTAVDLISDDSAWHIT
jgi:hypothetical protein